MKPKLDYHPSFINILMRTVAVAFSVAASHDLVKAEVSPVPLTQLPINTAAEKAENIPVAGSLNFTNPTDKRAIDAPVPASLNPTTTTTTENAPVPASLNPTTTTTENAPVPASLNPTTATTENAPVPASLNPNTATTENAPVPASLNPNTTTTEVSQTTKVVKILTPSADEVLSSPATSVSVQFSIGSQIELRVNGELVDSS